MTNKIRKTCTKFAVRLIKPLPRGRFGKFKVAKTNDKKFLDINGNFSKFSHKTWLHDSEKDTYISDIYSWGCLEDYVIYSWGCLEDYVELVEVKVVISINLTATSKKPIRYWDSY